MQCRLDVSEVTRRYDLWGSGYYWESVVSRGYICYMRAREEIWVMLIEHIYIKIIDEVVVTKLHIHIKEVIVQIHVDEGVRIDDDEVVLGRRSWNDLGAFFDEFASVLISDKEDESVKGAKGLGTKLFAKPVMEILYLVGLLQTPTGGAVFGIVVPFEVPPIVGSGTFGPKKAETDEGLVGHALDGWRVKKERKDVKRRPRDRGERREDGD